MAQPDSKPGSGFDAACPEADQSDHNLRQEQGGNCKVCKQRNPLKSGPKSLPQRYCQCSMEHPRAAQFSRGCQCLNTMQMPGYVWQALVSAEDRSFFHHPGIDFKGLARAVLFFGGRGGGSTLTQQLIKNLFLSDSKTISRCDSVICGGLEIYRSRVGLHSKPMPCKMIRHTAIPSPQANSA